MNPVIGRLALVKRSSRLEYLNDDGLERYARIAWWEVHRIVAVQLEPGRSPDQSWEEKQPFEWRILSQQALCEFHETADRKFVELDIDDVFAQRFDESDGVFFQKMRDAAINEDWLEFFSEEDALKAFTAARERGET